MKLILRASVTHLGEPGDLVEVKKGYARNYLLPNRLAIRATEANLRSIDHELTRLRAEAAEKRAQAEILAKSLADVSLTFARKVADVGAGTLYGSVSVADIGDELTELGFGIQRGEIHLEQPIKQLGEYDVPLSLAHGVAAAVHVSVSSEDGAAVEAAPAPVADEGVEPIDSAVAEDIDSAVAEDDVTAADVAPENEEG
ncbi:MAG TPA: 50S ribosomal protein L9 [Acidobacteriota bacterium]|nr:50S ribosomal protein L9 [Acidobacteriota bacterium]